MPYENPSVKKVSIANSRIEIESIDKWGALEELDISNSDVVVSGRYDGFDGLKRFNAVCSSFENNDYDLGDNVMVESELQDEYSVKDADEGFDDDLDEDALVRVLKEPRNSLVKQYKELLNMDNVELEITDAALHAIARKTIERKTGARGLRSVMESILMPIMYKVPSDATIIRVTIDEDTVEGGEPHLEYGAVRKRYKNQASLS